MQDIIQKFALQAQQKNIRLETIAYGTSRFVCADLGLVERALSNLIDNALSHTPEGGVIALQLDCVDDKVWVAVMDSGNGINEMDMPHIFDRFYRGTHARGQTSANAGLGLSIVRRIIDMHGETVEALNLPDHGALFRFSLPALHI
jgi:two-component system OmpR family sensor kinase